MTHDDDIPESETTTIQPEHRPPQACRAWALRFFPDDVEEENMADSIHPRPRPHQISVQQVQPTQVLPPAFDTDVQLPGGTTTDVPCPGGHEEGAGETTTPATSADQEPQLPACTAALNEPNSPQEDIQDPAATQSGSN